MKPVYGEPVLVGYSVDMADCRADFEVYHSIFIVSQGASMTPEQLRRYEDLKALFMPDGINAI